MRTIGFLKNIFNKNKAIEFSYDLDLAVDAAKRIEMKKLAINMCVSFLARTIAQAEFRVKEDNKYVKNELYYRLNIRPNKNQSASVFWYKVIEKLVYDSNECLVVQSKDKDLLIADTFTLKKYAVYEDIFSYVTVEDFTFDYSFKQSEVFYLKYSNEKLKPLIDALYLDYGELFGRILSAQKRKSQIRSTVKIDAATAKNKQALEELQNYIDQIYAVTESKDISVVPEQPGFDYKEHFSGSGVSSLSVDEVNKVTDGFLEQVASALHIPMALLRGGMADTKEIKGNYLFFTVNPLLKNITDEGNAKFIEKEKFLEGDRIDARVNTHHSIFELANSIDKLRSSGVVNGNEIRTELGLDTIDIPQMEEYFITKNYQEMTSLEGGEKD